MTYPFLKKICIAAALLSFSTVIACKPGASPRNEEAELAASIAAPITGHEFDGLSIKAELGFLGRISRKSPVDTFQSAKDLNALIQEMWKAFAGTSSSFRFVHCEARPPFPQSSSPADCSKVLKEPTATFEFSFLPIRVDTGELCTMLASEKCEIFQVVKLYLPDNGFQRAPVFARKIPVGGKLMLLNTHGIFYPRAANISRALGPWIAPTQTASILINPYSIPTELGKQLAELLGECGKQYMNLINFSVAGLRTSADYLKPAVVSGIFAKSATTGMTIAYAFGAMEAFRQAIAIRWFFRESYWVLAMPFVDVVTAIASLPYGITFMEFDEEMKRYPKDSPQWKALAAASLVTNVSMAGGLMQLGTLGAQHLKTTAKILGVTAAGSGVLMSENVQEIISDLRNGNISQVRYTLCNLERRRGKKVDCMLPEKATAICNK